MSPATLLSLLPLLGGCTGAPADKSPADAVGEEDSGPLGPADSGMDSGDSADPATTDEDGDGSVAAEDCDDADPSVFPGAVEVCNGVDDDCDGAADGADSADGRTWYLDADGDVYGDPATQVTACLQPAGYIAIGDDCDDANPLIHPRAVETCDGVDTDCDGTEDDATDAISWYADADGDGYGDAARNACDPPAGYVASPGDCDDRDARLFPGAPETCDGVDEDCDGLVDEDAGDVARWHADADGDGFGDPLVWTDACAASAGYVADATDCDDTNASVTVRTWYEDADGDGFGDLALDQCVAPVGYVEQEGDCDDGDPDVNPGAVEPCDAWVDANCDGTFGYADADGDGVVSCEDCDDADAGWALPPTWYADADADGFGDAAAPLDACYGPTGWVADATDCDDGDAATWPGAEEVWYDGLDEGCDGGDDWDADGDGYEPDADCEDFDASVNPAAVEVCDDGLDNDCDGDATACELWGDVSLADADVRIVGAAASDNLGAAFAGIPDVTADAGRSLVVCSYGYIHGSGAAYIFRSRTSALADLSPAIASATLTGEAWGDHAGFTAGAAGDVDGDGQEDFLVGAYLESTGAPAAGATYVVSGTVTGTASLSTAMAKLIGEHPADYSSLGLAPAGDLDGDGFADFLVTAFYDDTVAPDAGAVYLIHGPVSGTRSLAGSNAKLLGEAEYDKAGYGVATGDVDGDGTTDIVVPAFGADGAGGGEEGKVYVILSEPSGNFDLRFSDAVIAGTTVGEQFGKSIAVLDADADGYDDILAGGPGNSAVAHEQGAAYLFAGPLDSDRTVDDATWSVYGAEELEGVGLTVGPAGDVNADGVEDLLVGAQHGTTTHYSQAALFYGPVTGSVTLSNADFLMSAEAAVDDAGWAVGGVGDLNGDSLDDFVVGAPGYSVVSWQGAGYLWYGGGF